MQEIELRRHAAPKRGEYDVVVVGGGPAGCAAAATAAASGKHVLVIEKSGCLGGMATAGGHAHISLFTEYRSSVRCVGGFAHRLACTGDRQGWGEYTGGCFDFELEGLKLELERELTAQGCDLLYFSDFIETVMEGNRVRGVVVHNKQGLQYYAAQTVVDCTGDGDVAFSAGASFSVGRDGDHACQPVTLMFTVDRINWEKICNWRTDYHMRHIFLEARRNGDLGDFQSVIHGFWHTRTQPDVMGINFTNVVRVDGLNAVELTRTALTCREQIQQSLSVFRKYVPGMENARLLSSAEYPGVRETRRIHGDYMLETADLKAMRTFPDSIGFGSFLFDIHGIDEDGMDPTAQRPSPGFHYAIPYRILLPRGIENLLVAGRCVSASHLALSSIRVMASCMVTGEAAGMAAALAVERGVSPRNVPPDELQAHLRTAGAIITENDIKHHNEHTGDAK